MKLLIFLCIFSCTSSTKQSSSLIKAEAKYSKAYFAGGCFWCMESPFEEIDGVIEVYSGYSDGDIPEPTYESVSSGQTKYIEAIEVVYNPEKVTYSKLLDVFWRNINPTDSGGQFVDRGYQYSSAIFPQNKTEEKLAMDSKTRIKNLFSKKIVTKISIYKNFYKAEEYHQDYYKKEPFKYKRYRYYSGRDKFLEKHWSKGSSLRAKLTPLQYKVTQENGTEPPFKNKYWDNKKQGIYVGIISGEALFSSIDKFKSGTGWPSFTRTLEKENIVEVKDRSNFMERVEVRSKKGNSHLGHVFKDGPQPTGLRYCINSASLKFIPKEELKGSEYEKYLRLFID